jgi:hypothetical protein
MNAAQRTTLKVVLLIDALLILYPPFEGWHPRFGHTSIGWHWLLFAIFNGHSSVGIDFAKLAAEIVVVSLCGLTAGLLARGVPDDRTAAFVCRLSAAGRAVRKVAWNALNVAWYILMVIVVLLLIAIVAIMLVQIGVL